MSKKSIAIMLGGLVGVATAALVLAGFLHDGGAARAQGSADVKITNQVVIDQPDPKPPLAYPTIIVQEDNDVSIRKTLHNNGPESTVDTDITKNVSLAYYGSGDYGQCTVTPPSPVTDQVTLDESVSVDHDETFTINCDQGGLTVDDDADLATDEDIIGGAGVDNDGDTSVDEDACDGADNDGDTQIDEDDPGDDDDCDGTIDEDSPYYIVAMIIENEIDPKPGVTDPDPGNNDAVTQVFLAVIRPFTPTFSATIDDDQPDVQVDPVAGTAIVACQGDVVVAAGVALPRDDDLAV